MIQIDYQQLNQQHFDAVIQLGNGVHGDNYLDQPAIQRIYQLGLKDKINASWVAMDQDKLVGFRLTIAAGNWQPDKWCRPELWPTAIDKTCYFKCNTVNPDYQGSGIGSAMLKHSVESARQQGAQAGLAHIWLASPGNSAFKYFSKCGGKLIKEHPGKWLENCIYDGYVCPICGTDCDCVAAEMLLPFNDTSF